MADKQFIIRLNGLEVGNHLYEFKVTDSFFETRDYSDIQGANVKVSVELLKQNSVINLTFTISGTLHVLCDRCVKPYDVEIDSVEKMHLRFGDPDEAHAEDVFVLPHGENELDISSPLFEFITLALPARLVPCEEDKNFKCDFETLNKLNDISVDEPEQKPENTTWDKLKNINFNNN
ncbi:MAG TPA: DUF177 domain-containing protein [Bacteroidia bacterium]|nr:DUF177 domain-containing protein [Bacteroidia bacterium]